MGRVLSAGDMTKAILKPHVCHVPPHYMVGNTSSHNYTIEVFYAASLKIASVFILILIFG